MPADFLSVNVDDGAVCRRTGTVLQTSGQKVRDAGVVQKADILALQSSEIGEPVFLDQPIGILLVHPAKWKK